MQLAQVQNGCSLGGVRCRPAVKSNSLYTPPCTTSDLEEEAGSAVEPDLSDYYSDSGYPTRPRPRHILCTSSSSSARLRTVVAENGLERKVLAVNGHRPLQPLTHSPPRSRRVSAPSLPLPPRAGERTVKSRAFSKLRSLRNSRVLPAASSPDRHRPPSSLATTCLSASGGGNSATLPRAKQLRSFSVPSDTPVAPAASETEEDDMSGAQGKLKRAKKVGRALSFSLGSGDKKRKLGIFGSLGRNAGTEVSRPSPASRSPVLVARKTGDGRDTIYEEDRASVSSAEEQEDRLGSLHYLHGNRFGSCRELTLAGLGEADQKLRPLSSTQHKRPSLPSFTKLPSSTPHKPDPAPQDPPMQSDSQRTSPVTPSPSASPSHTRLYRRKLSDPGSAPGTPEHSPTAQRRASRDEVGVARSGRPIRKGFTFSVGGSNVSPDWKEMRHHVVRFLLETEQSYVQSLRTIIKVYLEPLKKPQAFGMIDSSLVRDIFFQIPEICSLHERFLLQISQRTERWHHLQKIGDVFVNTFSKCHLMNIYTMFIHNFMRAKAAIAIAKQSRPLFAKFLERSKATSAGKLSLDDLLIKPVQRIPRYLLFIKDLLKHTSVSHPDHAPLQQALDELTGLVERVNESEREMARTEKQRELLASVDGLALFVRPESELVRYDLVTEAQGSAYKRDRFLILFSDVLVCASTRRKSTGLRRGSLLNLSTLQPDSFRYKIKWSSPLKHLSLGEVQAPMVEKKKKNTLEKMIENLAKDEATLVQLIETSNTLRQPHQPLTSLLKDMLSELRQSIADKKTELENLPLLHSRVDLMCYNSLPPTQYSIVFPSQKIRNLWEEDFLKVKRSICSPLLTTPTSSSRGSPQPPSEGGFEFLHPLHVQSGRPGMELSCAGVGLPGDRVSYHNLWVACCDGYGGQVCLLDLQTSTRPHMVANITVSDCKILCISAVPQQDLVDDDRSSTSLSLASNSTAATTNLDVPLEDCAGGTELGPEVQLTSKMVHSMPRDIRGSLVASFSSDSSSTASISRSPSLASTRSETHPDPADDLEGVVTPVMPPDPAPLGQMGFRGHEEGAPRKRNGFHRVCSNSAPDLLKVVANVSPTEEGFREGPERGATSLSPPPPIEAKLWGLRSPPIVEGLSEEGSEGEGRGYSMWLGTEGGQILVYQPGSNLRSRSNRCTIQLHSTVNCIRYHRRRVFAGLGDGMVAVFDPVNPAAGHTHLIRVSSAPILTCRSVGNQLLVASQTELSFIDMTTMEAKPILRLPEDQLIGCVESACGDPGEGGERVWVSVRDQPLLHLFDLSTSSLVTSIDCSQKLHDALRGYDPVTRQNKKTSLRVTALLTTSHHHLLIGTSTGVILTLPSSPSSPSAPLSHLPHGHTGSVSFLSELQCCDSILVLSGGTGYENLTTKSTRHKNSEPSSCLLLWKPIVDESTDL